MLQSFAQILSDDLNCDHRNIGTMLEDCRNCLTGFLIVELPHENSKSTFFVGQEHAQGMFFLIDECTLEWHFGPRLLESGQDIETLRNALLILGFRGLAGQTTFLSFL